VIFQSGNISGEGRHKEEAAFEWVCSQNYKDGRLQFFLWWPLWPAPEHSWTGRENSPFITQVILLQPFQPSSPETLALFRDGRVMKLCQRKWFIFYPLLITREVIIVNDKWCSSIAKRQISAGATTVRWIDVLFMPPDGEAMGANDLYQEENPEYHRKSLCLALRWGITLCIKAQTGRRTMSRIKVIYFSHLEFAEFRLLF